MSDVVDFESCLSEVLSELSAAGLAFTLKTEQERALRHLFNGKDVMAVLPTGFGKSLIFQLFVLMCGVRSKRQGGTGFASIIVISPLQSIIRDHQVVEVNSMGMTACDLNEKLDCLDDNTPREIQHCLRVSWKPPWISVLSIQDSLFNENLAAYIVDESRHTV